MTYKLPEPDLYAHELIANGGGVWLQHQKKLVAGDKLYLAAGAKP